MEDDSFKYLGHETIGELVAELRNKMGCVAAYIDLLKFSKEPGMEVRLESLKNDTEKSMFKAFPLILQYLKEFEQYNLDGKKMPR